MYAEGLTLKSKKTGLVEWIDSKTVRIRGNIDGVRIPSRILEEMIQNTVKNGARKIFVKADGQHGIGGRIWPREEKVELIVEGPVGQRLGSMGMFGTEIVVMGSASNDVGWLNCGASIKVLGDVGDGAFNAAAQGILYVKGSGGARCDTLTKHNPRFDPPQSWYLRDVGDSFAEFKAGGISVVCGYNPRNPENILGYRPCVGMVGGVIFFRGRIREYSEKDVKLLPIDESDWTWLITNVKEFLRAIGEEGLYKTLTSDPKEWMKLVALKPEERKKVSFPVPMSEFRKKVWEKEVGKDGIFAEYIDHERWTVIPYVVTGDLRRTKPVWENEKYLSPCTYACPTKIPVNKILSMVRAGNLLEANRTLLLQSPLPRTVCGQLCPNLCMDACTRCALDSPVGINKMGELSVDIEILSPKIKSSKKIAVIGCGPAGMSVGWHLTLRGYPVDIFEVETKLGGKIELLIPRDRFAYEIFKKETERFLSVVKNVHLGEKVTRERFLHIYNQYDLVIIASGTHSPRRLNFPGSEYVVSAYEFLREINEGKKPDFRGKNVLIIGAGNVGMDVASQAYVFGAESVYAIDIQRPKAFGKELEIAQKKGVQIIWPKNVKEYDRSKKRVLFDDGTSLKADFVFVAIGDIPQLDFVPKEIVSQDGWIKINECYQTEDPKIYAIGDITGQGLITHAIGHGKKLADYIDKYLSGCKLELKREEVIPYERIKKEYYYGKTFDERNGILAEAERCLSCGSCRDCHLCEATCYHMAIKRIEKGDREYEYVVEHDKCIACGFCAYVCPCGVWEMTTLP
ncbi:MAG: FAD-dependent oxidoreductase [Deltaproteobacteria bacterium]|nr:FAD-dependent oxidoreductase [Deltaproteobacteria bacterium]